MKRLALPVLLVFAVAACGSAQSPAQDRGEKLTVFSAASLSRVLPKLDGSIHYEFAGSNTLELQIEQGAPADVFVSASPKYLLRLKAEHLLLEAPGWFATNRLVLIVPKRNPAHIRTVGDLARRGVRLVLADEGVPAGDYARKALAAVRLKRALDNVVSLEPDVEGVVAKVSLAEADAGFVYASDADAVADKVKVVPLPPAARETAVYGAAVLKSSDQSQLGRGFVALLLSPPGQKELEDAGFGPAPKKPPKK